METILAVPVATSKPGYFLLHPIAPEMETTQSKGTLSDDAQGQHEGGTAGNRKQVKSTRRSFTADPNRVPNRWQISRSTGQEAERSRRRIAHCSGRRGKLWNSGEGSDPTRPL